MFDKNIGSILFFYFFFTTVLYVVSFIYREIIATLWVTFLPLIPVLIIALSITKHHDSYKDHILVDGKYKKTMRRVKKIVATNCYIMILCKIFLKYSDKEFSNKINLSAETVLMSVLMLLTLHSGMFFCFGRSKNSLWTHHFTDDQ